MQTLKAFATADPSFAGPGAYYSNVPMKVFMGSEPPLPLEVAAAALDSLQSGKASPGQIAQVKQGLQPHQASASCLAEAAKACAVYQVGASGDAADSQYQMCMQQHKAQCAAVGQQPPRSAPAPPKKM
jgi:hypothetical protein